MRKAILAVLVILGIIITLSGINIVLDNWQLSQFPDSRIVPVGTEDEGRLRAIVGLILFGLAYFLWSKKPEKTWDGSNSQPYLNFENLEKSRGYKKPLGYH